MATTIPVFTDKVTMVPADWANTVSQMVYGVFQGQLTAAGVVSALGLGTLAWQNSGNVQISGGALDAVQIGFNTPGNAKFTQAFILGTPSNPQHAVNKQYVDNAIINAQGALVTLSQYYVARNGSTMTGMLTLASNPVLDMQAATKQYVDNAIISGNTSGTVFSTYTALRLYNGSGNFAQITGIRIAGHFYRDDSDTTSADNNGTIIIDALNRRWKRVYKDVVAPEWFGAVGDGNAHDEAAFVAAAATQQPITMREGAVYVFGATATINGGMFVLRNAATIRLAANTIVNTDSNHTNFTPLLRLQGMTYVDLGTTIFDHNSANQTYPATAATFGRGTAPFLHNGSVEITPATDNTTESTNIHVNKAQFINSYLNGLVVWQCRNVWVSDNYFDTTTMAGIKVVGGASISVTKNKGRLIGQNAQVPASRVSAVRALVHLDYFPSGITSATEGLPCIVTGNYVNGGIIRHAEVSENEGVNCMTNTIYMRGVLGLAGGRNRSYNVGSNWSTSAPFRSAHFYIAYCEGTNTENQSYQDTVNVADYTPDGMWALPLQGISSAFPLAGKFSISVRGFRAHSAKDSNGNAIAGLMRCGLVTSSGVRAQQLDIDGTSADGVLLMNAQAYESPLLVAHDGEFSNSRIVNVAGGFFPIRILSSGGSPTGSITNVRAENMTTDTGVEPIGYDASVSGVGQINVRYSLGLYDVHTTAENAANSTNGTFYRQSSNSNTGINAKAGFQAVADNGQTMTMAVSSAAGGAQGLLQTSASATGGMAVVVSAGKLTITTSTLAMTVFGSGSVGIGASANADDGNTLQIGGMVSIGRYTVATLPATPTNNPLAYATNGRKVGEGSGAGTGVPVYYSNGAWRVFSTDAAVQA